VLAAQEVHQADALGHDKRRHVDQTDNASRLAVFGAGALPKVIGGATARDAAIGVADHDDIFSFGLDQGKDLLANGLGVNAAGHGQGVAGVEAGEIGDKRWVAGTFEVGYENIVVGGWMPSAWHDHESWLRGSHFSNNKKTMGPE